MGGPGQPNGAAAPNRGLVGGGGGGGPRGAAARAGGGGGGGGGGGVQMAAYLQIGRSRDGVPFRPRDTRFKGGLLSHGYGITILGMNLSQCA